MWTEHDGTSPHFSREVTEYLNAITMKGGYAGAD